jgi:ABC-type sugar transport system substrate-binding protein
MARSTRLLTAALMLLVVFGIVAAGCGSSDDDTTAADTTAAETGGGEGASAGIEEAKEFVSENTDLEGLEWPEPPDEPYDPGSGKMGIVTCSTAGTGCIGMAKQVVKATEAAGWEPSEIADGKFTPSVQSGIVQRFVQEGMDGITIVSIDLSSIKSAVDAAEKAGIPMSCVSCTPSPGFEPTKPVPLASTPGKFGGELLGNFVVSQSEPGDTILQYVDKAFPIIIERAAAVKDAIETKCSECSYEEQQVATEELTKPGPPYFTSALASHPEGELDWAFLSSDTFNIPMVDTAVQQGRQVKMAGIDGEAAWMEEMAENPEIARGTVWQPFNYSSWAGVEQVIRVANGLDVWDSYSTMPAAIIDDQKEVDAALAVAPDYYSPPDFDYEAKFKELWSGK